MTFPPVSLTMPSVDCPAPFRPPRALVLDRIKQRFQRYDRHGQKCRERYNGAQRIIRANEKRQTDFLWQRVQEYKNKKGGKFKTDASRQKSTPETNDASDSLYPGMARLKRKLQLGDEGLGANSGGYGENSGNDQHDPKKPKNDLPPGSQRQEYPLGSVSVHIVQNYGNEAAKRIETTVNVQSTGNMPDSQSVSVNVGSKNIKQETMNDGRPGQQQMNQSNANRGNNGNPDSNDLGGLINEDMMSDGDGDLDDLVGTLLDDWIQQFPQEEVDALLTSESQQQMMSQLQHMTSQQMTSQSQQMTSQSQQMTSQSQQMTSQTQHMTSQTQQMTSPAHNMTSPPHMPSPGQQMTSPTGRMTSQSSQIQQQSARMLCKSEKVDSIQGFHGSTPENKGENMGMPRNPHGMSQQSISANIMTQQSMRVNNFSASAQQNISLSMSSSSGQQSGFHGNLRPSNNMPSTGQPGHFHGNMPPSSMPGYPGNMTSSSGQQSSYLGNMTSSSSGQLGGFPGNLRPSNNSTANNNNMTSQHIHKLNQVTVNSQFAPHEAPEEPPRLFHPPTQAQGPQIGYYEHSQQLKQLAEKRWEMNSSASVNMTSDIRASQTFQGYRGNEVHPMSQQLNMPSHPMSSAPGSQRLSHLDPSLYSRSSQQFPPDQRSETVSIMMQQSMQMQQENMMKQRAAQMQMQGRQAAFYNRMTDPSHHPHSMPQNPNSSFPNNGSSHPSWNPRGPWPGSQVPLQNQLQRHPSDLPPGNYLPELDLQSNDDLNILDEILSK